SGGICNEEITEGRWHRSRGFSASTVPGEGPGRWGVQDIPVVRELSPGDASRISSALDDTHATACPWNASESGAVRRSGAPPGATRRTQQYRSQRVTLDDLPWLWQDLCGALGQK